MAFESKTELKARVATNKLEANLLNNMIDSMVSLESDGDLVVDGDVQADSVTTDEVVAKKLAVGNIRISDTITAIGMNCEYDGADWKAVANGYCEYTLFDEATGLTSVYKTDIVASAGGTVTGDFNKVSERDRHGNTAEGGASLTDKTLQSPRYLYEFTGDNVIMTDTEVPITYTTENCYFNGSGWSRLNALYDAKIEGTTYNSTSIYQIPTGVADGSWTVDAYRIYERDEYGNTAEGGASIPSDIKLSFEYHFTQKGCSYTDSSGINVTCTNCYPTSTAGAVPPTTSTRAPRSRATSRTPCCSASRSWATSSTPGRS